MLTARCFPRGIPPPQVIEGGRVARGNRRRGVGAPRYEFLRESCQKAFELIMTIAEREKAKPKCPTCKGTKVRPQFIGFTAQASKKS